MVELGNFASAMIFMAVSAAIGCAIAMVLFQFGASAARMDDEDDSEGSDSQ